MTIFAFVSWIWIQIFYSDSLGFVAMYGASTYYFSSEGDLNVGSA